MVVRIDVGPRRLADATLVFVILLFVWLKGADASCLKRLFGKLLEGTREYLTRAKRAQVGHVAWRRSRCSRAFGLDCGCRGYLDDGQSVCVPT